MAAAHDKSPLLFCFPHAGVGASAYRGWFEAAAGALSVVRVQLPGRESRLREPAQLALPVLVDELTEAVLPRLTRPFAFLGHSLGATLAFEVARELRRRGAPLPRVLVVAARQAPHIAWRHPAICHLDDSALLIEVGRRYGSVPAIMLEDAELRGLLTPALRADLSLVETYSYAPEGPFAFPIVACGGIDDRMVARDEILAWSQHTTGEFRSRMFPNGHLFVSEQRDALLEEIRSVFVG